MIIWHFPNFKQPRPFARSRFQDADWSTMGEYYHDFVEKKQTRFFEKVP